MTQGRSRRRSTALFGETLVLDLNEIDDEDDESQQKQEQEMSTRISENSGSTTAFFSPLKQTACQAATSIHQELATSSKIRKALYELPKVLSKDLVVEELLFSLGGCDYHQVTSYKLSSMLMKANERQFTLKQVKQPSANNEQGFVEGARDLAREVVYLSQLSHKPHPNIIHCRAVSLEGPNGYVTGEGCFTLLELLSNQTLQDKLQKWQTSPQSPSVLDRICMACDVASALVYMHSQKLVYRDLKPASIGFAMMTGKIKLIDMGCVRRVDDITRTKEKVGTIPYVAPEVLRAKQQSADPTPADVYSVSMLVWQLMTFQKVEFHSEEAYVHFIWNKNSRPQLPKTWTQTLKFLITSGWTSKPEDRPTMKQFHYWLNKEASMMEEQQNKQDQAQQAKAVQMRRARSRSPAPELRPMPASRSRTPPPTGGRSNQLNFQHASSFGGKPAQPRQNPRKFRQTESFGGQPQRANPRGFQQASSSGGQQRPGNNSMQGAAFGNNSMQGSSFGNNSMQESAFGNNPLQRSGIRNANSSFNFSSNMSFRSQSTASSGNSSLEGDSGRVASRVPTKRTQSPMRRDMMKQRQSSSRRGPGMTRSVSPKPTASTRGRQPRQFCAWKKPVSAT